MREWVLSTLSAPNGTAASVVIDKRMVLDIDLGRSEEGLPVAVVHMVVDKKDTRTAAVAYLKFTYSPEGQKISAKNYYRPRNSAVAKKYVHELSQPSSTVTLFPRPTGGRDSAYVWLRAGCA